MDSLVVLSFHPAFYPPKSGGELRLFNIYKNLSEKFHITLVTFTYPGVPMETVDHTPNFREIRIPKTNISVTLHHLVDRLSNIKECSAVVTSIESRFNREFKKVMEKEVARANAVIFVYPFLYTVPKKWLKGKKVIYESHNVEYQLMKASFSRSLLGRLMLIYVKWIEGSLLRNCDAAFAVSEDDRQELSRLYRIDKEKIMLSYNGIDLTGPGMSAIIRAGARPDPLCIFIGSFHPPNIEAVDSIIDMAAGMPEVKFLIAGGVTAGFVDKGRQKEQGPISPGTPECITSLASYKQSDNVWLIGRISDGEKIKIYNAADIALNPMLSGSGTNIKMLDYMAAGLPIITTPTGARGLNLVNRRHAVICDITEFPAKIRELSADKALFTALCAGGRRLVEERYDWKSISKKMIADLEKVLNA